MVSGGHTHLFEVREGFAYRLLGKTRDDAAGEAYDKVAKLLGFGYPGGPIIDQLAPHGDPRAVKFTLARMKGNTLDFSFSGLKTAVLRWVEQHDLTAEIEARRRSQGASAQDFLPLTPQPTLDLLASFQHTVIEELLRRAAVCIEEIGARSLIISGGVASNAGLRAAARAAGLACPVYFPTPALSTDNAAMIAAAAFPKLRAGHFLRFLASRPSQPRAGLTTTARKMAAMPRRLFRCLLLIACASFAAVTRIDVTERSDDGGLRAHRREGPFRRRSQAPSPIESSPTSISAPRNAEGKVEFSADLYILRPRDAAKRNGTLLVEIPNRGGKGLVGMFNLGDNFLLEQGFTLVWVGWEFDLPPTPGLLRVDAPIATNNGKPITGLVRSEWEGGDGAGTPAHRPRTISLGDRDQIGYAVADPQDPANKIFVRDTVEGQRRLISARRLELLRSHPCHHGRRLRARQDLRSRLPGQGPGAGRSRPHRRSRRRVVSQVWWRGHPARRLPQRHPARHRLRRLAKRPLSCAPLCTTASTRTKTRAAFSTAVWADIAGAGRGGFNARFAQPSRDGHPFFNILYPVDVPPFTDEARTSNDGLLASAKVTETVPKIFYTNGSYEYWGRAASLIHTTPDGKQDAPLAKDTRIYFFPGSRHGTGSLPPRHLEAQNLDSTNDYTRRHASAAGCDASLAGRRQTAAGFRLPADRAQGSSWSPSSAYAFPKIPGVATPHYNRQAFRLDFSIEPPKLGPPFPTLVPQVNLDGNETSGIRMPEIQVPLASYTGWNLRSPKIGAPDQLYSMAGSWIPFPVNKAEREKRKDPRPSIEERYPTKDDYLEKITAAAQQLVKEGFLLDRDIVNLRDRAAQEWDYAYRAATVRERNALAKIDPMI